MERGHVVIGPDSVTKHYSPETLDLELEKSRSLYQCARDCGFVAPEPLRVDRNAGTITFEFIDGLNSIRNSYLALLKSRNMREEHLEELSAAGAALANFHRRVSVSETRAWKTPPELREFKPRLESTPQALLHGDFGFSNVLITSRTGKRTLCVIDASPNMFSTFWPHEVGSIYVDIAHFLSCLDGTFPIWKYPGARWSRLPEIREAFLSGYEAASGLTLDRGLLTAMAVSTSRSYFHYRYGSGWRFRFAMKVLYNAWKGNSA